MLKGAVRGAVALLPDDFLGGVCIVVIARDGDKGDGERSEDFIDRLPFGTGIGEVIDAAFDEVADADDEIRVKEVGLGHGIFENAWAVAARIVCKNGKAEGLVGGFERQWHQWAN